MNTIESCAPFKVFLNHEFSRVPKKAHPSDTGYDISSCEYITIPSKQWRAVCTGLHFQIPNGWEIQLRARSGLAFKKGIGLMNGIGSIDSSYIGEIKVILYNAGEFPFEIAPGDKIAQAVMCPVFNTIIEVINKMPEDTERGHNGFGSTDKK